MIDFMVVHSLLVVLSSTRGPLPRILVFNLSPSVISDDIVYYHSPYASCIHRRHVPYLGFRQCLYCSPENEVRPGSGMEAEVRRETKSKRTFREGIEPGNPAVLRGGDNLGTKDMGRVRQREGRRSEKGQRTRMGFRMLGVMS